MSKGFCVDRWVEQYIDFLALRVGIVHSDRSNIIVTSSGVLAWHGDDLTVRLLPCKFIYMLLFDGMHALNE